MTTTSEVLHSLRFGHSVAERDSVLKSAFVQTADFKALQSGQYDLITGVKGSGKSALMIMLIEEGAFDTEIIIAPAQNVNGESVYGGDLPEDRQLLTSDEYFRERWMIHAYSVAAAHLLRVMPDDLRLNDLRIAVMGIGLDPEKDKPKDLWRKVSQWNLTGTAFTPLPKPETGATISKGAPLDGDSLRDLLFNALEQTEREIWVAYDRLDDVLAFDPERERAMLRGLLAAMVSLASSSPRFHVKAFMRHDLFDRVTEERPVRNVDQLARLRLRWNTPAVMRLIAARVVRSPHAAEAFDVEADQDPSLLSKEDVDKIWLALLWKRTHLGSDEHPDRHFVGFLQGLADGSGQFNPRVLLAFFSLMARLQAASDEESDRQLPASRPLIQDSAAQKALVDVSDARLNQYIYAEFQHLKPYVRSLVEKPNAFRSKGELLQALGLRDEPRSTEIIRELVGCGLLATGEKSFAYSIAKLYKPALRSQKPRSSSAFVTVDSPRPSAAVHITPRDLRNLMRHSRDGN